MKFCTKCEKPLEFFEFLEGNLCSACAGDPSSQPEQKKSSGLDLNGLSGAILCVENGRVVLKSPEGWTLWSATANDSTDLQTIITRAQRILEIRKKNRT